VEIKPCQASAICDRIQTLLSGFKEVRPKLAQNECNLHGVIVNLLETAQERTDAQCRGAGLNERGKNLNVAILHYAAPPVVGGVEQTIYHHALELARAGHTVRILTGSGAEFDPRVPVTVVPEFGSRHSDVLAVKKQLDQGQVTPDFGALHDRLVSLLSDALADADALIAHNVFTLHKNLPLTSALFELTVKQANYRTSQLSNYPTILAWHHDLAWDDPRYADDVHDGYPWDLLRTPWPGVRHVTVSASQQGRLAALYGISPEQIAVVPPGVDPARFLHWTGTTRQLMDELGWLDADLLFLLPARITRRKNVEMALRILAAFRAQTGLDARLIVTSPPGAHNPANAAYLQSLLDLRRELGLENTAHFLYELNITPDDDTMANLYQWADALLFPSAKEGFGIPILEAGLARLPIFCADIPPLRETGEGAAHLFDLHGDPDAIAADIAQVLERDAAHRLRRRVLARFTWRRIVQERVIPLLHSSG
jgi:glycosyltransferase involved in cell wall biosynthesis